MIQNSASTTTLLDADTTDGYLLVGSSTPVTSGAGATTLQVTGSGNFTTGLYLNGVAVCTVSTCASGSSSSFINNGTSSQVANFNIKSASTTSVAATVQGAASGTADLLDVKNGSGTTVQSIGSTGNALFQNSANSSAAFQIQNASSTPLLVANTTNTSIGIAGASTTAGYALNVTGSSNISGNFSTGGEITTGGSFDYSNSALYGGGITKPFTSGSVISTSDVVVMNSSGQAADTTTARDTRVLGISNGNTAGAGSTVIIFLSGYGVVNVGTGAVAVGDQLVTSTTAGQAMVDNSATTGIIGYATTAKAGGSAGTVGLRIEPTNTSSTPDFRPTTDSTTAFMIQNSASTTTLLDADTTDGYLLVGSSTPVTSGAGATTLQVTGSINATSQIYVSGVAVCTISTCASSSASGNYIQSGITVQTANFNIQSTVTTSATAVIQARSGQTADLLDLVNSSSTNVLTVGPTGSVLIEPSTNNIIAFQIQNASASSNLFVADTTNNVIGIDRVPISTGAALQVGGAINSTAGIVAQNGGAGVVTIGTNASTAVIRFGVTGGPTINGPTGGGTGALTVNGTSSGVALIVSAGNPNGDILRVENSSNIIESSIGASGAALFENTTNSTTAFQVQNSSGASIFDTDSTNSRVGISNSAPGNLLSIGALTTASSGAQIAVSTGGTTNSGIVVQTVSSQSSGYVFQAQNSSGTLLAGIDYQGNLTVKAATINGNLTLDGHIITANTSGTTTATVNSNAGTSSTCAITGDDTGGVVTLTTGTASWASGAQCTITFANAYGVAPNPVITNASAVSTSTVQPYVSSTTTTMVINFYAADTATHTFKFDYFNSQ
jgi:hypothetical protein